MMRFVLEVFFLTKGSRPRETRLALKRLEATRLSTIFARLEQFNQKTDIFFY